MGDRPVDQRTQEMADRLLEYMWETASPEAKREFARVSAYPLIYGEFPPASEIERVARMLAGF